MRTDPLSGVTDGLLKRTASDPLIMHVNSSTEYWERRASLLDTDENGIADLVESPNVRRYRRLNSKPAGLIPSGRGSVRILGSTQAKSPPSRHRRRIQPLHR